MSHSIELPEVLMIRYDNFSVEHEGKRQGKELLAMNS